MHKNIMRRATPLRVITSALIATAAASYLPSASAALALPESGPVTLMTITHVKPAAKQDFVDVMGKNVAHSRTEPGNLRFDVFVNDQGNGKSRDVTVFILESWKDAAAMKQHWKEPTLLALHDAVKRDAAKPPASTVVEPLQPAQ